MVEWAVFSKFTITTFLPKFARSSLKVRKTGSSDTLCNVLRKRIIGLSKLWRTMSKLAVRFKWAILVLNEMLTHLSLILLFKCFDIAMTSWILTLSHLELLQNLVRRVVEVTRTPICEVTFSLIPILSRWMLTIKTAGRSCCLKWWISVLFCEGARRCCHLLSLLQRLLSIWRSIKRGLSRILAFYYINFIGLVLLMN
jgi:hypothetical protein